MAVDLELDRPGRGAGARLCTLIAAVKETAWPNTDGLPEETTTVLVLAWLTIWPPATCRCCR